MDRDEALSVSELARQAGSELNGPNAAEWLRRLEHEHARLRAALEWFVQQGMGVDALALVATVWRFWLARGDSQEGRELLDAALNAPGAGVPSGDRAKALYGVGVLSFRLGENERSRQLNEESLAVARAVGNRSTTVAALVGLARVALRQGDYV